MRDGMTCDIAIDALCRAWFKRYPARYGGQIFHSDRGSQYAREDFRDVLGDNGISESMSCRGNCWNNICSGTLFGSLEVGPLHGQRFLIHGMPRAKHWLGFLGATRPTYTSP